MIIFIQNISFITSSLSTCPLARSHVVYSWYVFYVQTEALRRKWKKSVSIHLFTSVKTGKFFSLGSSFCCCCNVHFLPKEATYTTTPHQGRLIHKVTFAILKQKTANLTYITNQSREPEWIDLQLA